MPLAALLGIALFAEVPDVWTVTGMAIIALSSAYIARREAMGEPPPRNGAPGAA